MSNHRPETKFFNSEKNRIGFPAFQEGFPSKWGMNKNTKFDTAFVIPFKSWLLVKLTTLAIPETV